MSKFEQYGEKFLELRSQGMSYRRIADEVAVSVTTLKKWGLEWEDKIQEMGQARLQAFVDQQLMDLESRLRLRGEQILSMQQELAARDLGEMESSLLLRLYLRYLESVQKEVAPLRVEVNSTMQNYEQILLRCAKVEQVHQDDEEDLNTLRIDGQPELAHKLPKT